MIYALTIWHTTSARLPFWGALSAYLPSGNQPFPKAWWFNTILLKPLLYILQKNNYIAFLVDIAAPTGKKIWQCYFNYILQGQPIINRWHRKNTYILSLFFQSSCIKLLLFKWLNWCKKGVGGGEHL